MNSILLKHKDFNTRIKSRSGGFFTVLSDYVLENNGVVYGVVLENLRTAKHVRTETKEGRDSMRGSKYIPSHLGDSLQNVKKDLEDGRLVLFTGTPCQCQALNNYLKRKYDNLIVADIVCHAGPVEKVWPDYVDYIEKENKIASVDFRNKYKFGWKSHEETFYLENGNSIDSNLYRRLYFSHLIVKKACFNCKFKNLNRVTDFTFCDAWGIEEANPEFNDDNGVSLVLINTDQAKNVFSKLKDFDYIDCDINKYLQPPLSYNWPIPKKYDKFWKVYNTKGFEKAIQYFKKEELIEKIKNKLKK